MRFFNRRKKHSPESYYDYYEDHGVVPNTIEYYLEFGEEVEAEDIYWDIPKDATVENMKEDGEEGDDESTTVSFVPENIPVLTIVDASTNIPITSTLFPWNQSNATDVTKTTICHSSSRRTSSEYTGNTRTRCRSEDDSSSDEETAADDVVEPGFLEATLSEYEGKALQHQDSMGGKSICAISTVGFKSAAASAAAAQKFASQYIRCKSRDESSVAGQEQGEVEVEAQISREIVQNDTLSLSHCKSVIPAPHKKRDGNEMYSRIILHADKAGETTIKMTRESSVIPQKNTDQSKSTMNSVAGCIGSKIVVPAVSVAVSTKGEQDMAVAPIPSEVAKMQTIINTSAGTMPSLLDDDLSSLCNTNSAKSSNILTDKSKPSKGEQDTALAPITSVMNTNARAMPSLLDDDLSSLGNTNTAKSSSILTNESKPSKGEQDMAVAPIPSEVAKMQTVMNINARSVPSFLDDHKSSLGNTNTAKSSSILTNKSKLSKSKQNTALGPIPPEVAKMQTVVNTNADTVPSLLDDDKSSPGNTSTAKSSSIVTDKTKARKNRGLIEKNDWFRRKRTSSAEESTNSPSNALVSSILPKLSISDGTKTSPLIPPEVAKMQTVVNTNADTVPSLLDDDKSSPGNTSTAKSSSIVTDKTKARKNRGLIGKNDWFRRKRTSSAEESTNSPSNALVSSIHPKLSISDGPKTSPFPAPLVILYDDKRNEMAWLRCAPRRRNFEFPLSSAAAITKSPVDGSPIKPAAETTIASKTTSEDLDPIAGNDGALMVGARETSLTKEQSSPQTRDVSFEERDPPPSDNTGVSNSTATTKSNPERSTPDRGLSILEESIDEESSGGPEIFTVESTITYYKRQLVELQRRNEDVVKMIHDSTVRNMTLEDMRLL
ncbi:hypothetical protein IV203_014149 [Nitzschia inconspicua]|uniref:Uncharacterized protein n=1 Tax=Nitzschia inconspicua TaxID=303405 RepID=A0A9K3M6V1_9STRA|nr:hypothetical protein IV203_014149 [Nitzschia inconspicua]